MNKIITLLALLLFSFSLYGQELSNLRYKSLPVRSDSILLDSLSIIPESITVTDSAEHRLPKSSYRMDCINAVIYLNNSKHHTLSFR
ncbi:MAG: hypothetical protein U9N85_01460, partial [Bacteroidota bacterium]|nr:hypothetical protein [Bacteroidota bacterium]